MSSSLGLSRSRIAAAFTWAAFSSWTYILWDVIPIPDKLGSTLRWEALHNEIADWLIKYVNQPIRGISTHEYPWFREQLSALIDSFVLEWGKISQVTAQQASVIVPSIDVSSWCYLSYCRWLPVILSRLDEIIQSESDEPEYLEKQPGFSALSAILGQEYDLGLEAIDSVSKIKVSVLIQAKGEELLAYWNSRNEAALQYWGAG